MEGHRAVTSARVEEIAKVVRSVQKKVKFPVRNFKQLATALGGEDAQITYGGKERKVGQVGRMVPADYFPIDSAEELIAKIADLQARAEPGWPGPVDNGTELEKIPEDAGAPTVAAEYTPGKAHGNGPAVKGWKTA